MKRSRQQKLQGWRLGRTKKGLLVGETILDKNGEGQVKEGTSEGKKVRREGLFVGIGGRLQKGAGGCGER